jgi:hypothetical protein
MSGSVPGFRNSLGQLLLGNSGFLLSTATVLEDEFITLLESIKTTISNGTHIVLFEIDCMSPVDTFTSSIVSISEFDNLVSSCLSLLSSNPNYVMCFVKEGKLIGLPMLLLEHYYLTLTPLLSIIYHLLCTIYL